MKFKLNEEIDRWKKSLHAFQGFEPENIEELEDHLRSDIEQKVKQGKTEEEAFMEARTRIKNVKEISELHIKMRNNSSLFLLNIRFLLKILRRNKSHSFQSLAGLIVGITICTITFYYANYELSYDTFHEKTEALFRVRVDVVSTETGEYQNRRATGFYALPEALKDEIPEITESTILYPEAAVIINEEDNFSIDKVLYTSESFFNMFTIPLKWGSSNEFDSPDGIFISATLAERLYGEENPLGKQFKYLGVRTGGDFTLQVRGVFEDVPKNSYFKNTDVFLPIQIFKNLHTPTLSWAPITIEQVKWRWTDFYTFIEVQSGANVVQVQEKIQDVLDRNRREFDANRGRKQVASMEPMDEINLVTGLHNELEAGVNKEILWLFFGIGIMVMIIAWINYVNMSTATSISRSKEIGIKKALGAIKKQLVSQFLLESTVLTMLALFISIALVLLISGRISEFFDIQLAIGLQDLPFFLTLTIIILLGSIIAGIYPAMILSSFKTVDILKTASKNSGANVWVRKILVVFQFAIVAFLLTGALVVYQQFQFMINKDLGIDINGKIAVDLPNGIFLGDDFDVKTERLLSSYRELPQIKTISGSSMLPGDINGWRHSLSVDGGESQNLVVFNRMSVSDNYIEDFDIKIIAGRPFDKNITSDYAEALIINRSGMEQLGFSSPDSIIGKSVSFAVGPQAYKVVGVAEDFHHQSVHSIIEPLSIQFDSAYQEGFLAIDFEGDFGETIQSLEEKYAEVFPEVPFNFNFLDSRYREQYESDLQFQNIFRIITVVSILLAIIGLLALSTYFLNQQKKSVSVRKVLGAEKWELVRLVTREYLLLIIIACAISIPLSIISINRWLEGFVFRISVNPLLYVLPTIILSAIVLLTISRNTSKLVNVNPARTLRND